MQQPLIAGLVCFQLSNELWPPTQPADVSNTGDNDSDAGAEDDDNIEAQIAKEVASMNKPRRERRFGTSRSVYLNLHKFTLTVANCDTGTPCGWCDPAFCTQHHKLNHRDNGSGIYILQGPRRPGASGRQTC